jgi:hypothetical protein
LVVPFWLTCLMFSLLTFISSTQLSEFIVSFGFL